MSTPVDHLFEPSSQAAPPVRTPGLFRKLPPVSPVKPLDESFEKWGKQYEVDPELLRRMHGSEDPSKGKNPSIQSWAGATGPMQLMPGTAARYKVNPADPDDNIRGSAAYMRDLLDEFGDVRKAVAAYNAGEGAIRKHGFEKVRKFSNYPKGDPRRGGYAGSTGAYVDKITEGYTGYGYHPARAAAVADLFDETPDAPASDVSHLFDPDPQAAPDSQTTPSDVSHLFEQSGRTQLDSTMAAMLNRADPNRPMLGGDVLTPDKGIRGGVYRIPLDATDTQETALKKTFYQIAKGAGLEDAPAWDFANKWLGSVEYRGFYVDGKPMDEREFQRAKARGVHHVNFNEESEPDMFADLRSRAQTGAVSQGEAPSLMDRASEKAAELTPGLQSINTPMGVRTVAAEEAILRAVNTATLGLTEWHVDPKRFKDEAEARKANDVAVATELLAALVPLGGAAKAVGLISKIPRLARAIQLAEEAGTVGRFGVRTAQGAATFGGVQAAREGIAGLQGESDGLLPAAERIGRETLIGGVMGGVGVPNVKGQPLLPAPLRAGVVGASTLAINKAAGLDDKENLQAAATNAAFELLGGLGNRSARRGNATALRDIEALKAGEVNYVRVTSKDRMPSVPSGYTKTQVTGGDYVIHPKSVTRVQVRKLARMNTLEVLDMTDADGHPFISPSRPRATAGRTAVDIINATKSLKSAADLPLLRQGLMFLSEPRAWYRGMKQGIRSLNELKYEDIVTDIEAHPMRQMAEDSGLYLATQRIRRAEEGGQSTASAREESFPSRAMSRAPVVGASERSYQAAMDTMRLETYKRYADAFLMNDIHPETHPKVFTDLSRRINSMSGRGDLGRLEPYAAAMNVPIFSPRLLKARYDILNPREYMRFEPEVRAIAVKQTAKVTAAILSTLMLAKMAGADIETDIEKADFGKIKIGNTRYDVTAGTARFIRLPLQLVNRLANGKFAEAGSLALQEARKNLSPSLSYGVNAVVGSDVTGRKFDVAEDSIRLVAPIFLEELYDAYDAEGITGTLKTLPSGVGIGVQTYGKDSEQYTEEVLKGHQPRPEREVNPKLREKVENDPQLKTIATELGKLKLDVNKARQRKGESDDDYNSRLESQEPKIKSALYEFVTSPEYQNLTDVERKQSIKRIVQEIRHTDEESDFSGPAEEESGDTDIGARSLSRESMSPVPESPETLAAQFKSAHDSDSPRAGVLITPGEKTPPRTPDGFFWIDAPGGKLYLNKEKVIQLGLMSASKLQAYVAEPDNVATLIGKASPVDDTTQGMSLRTEGAQGDEFSTSVVTSPEAAIAQAEMDRAQFPEAASQELMPTSEAVRKRVDEQAGLTDGEWQQFPEESGSLNIPRAAMPQIKSAHRRAMVQFLKGRGITHAQEEVLPTSLKPTQAEFSPEKVNKARSFDGEQRSILVSSDDHVVDGHHQWLSDLTDALDEPIPIIRLNAPIQQVLLEVTRFPSSFNA